MQMWWCTRGRLHDHVVPEDRQNSTPAADVEKCSISVLRPSSRSQLSDTAVRGRRCSGDRSTRKGRRLSWFATAQAGSDQVVDILVRSSAGVRASTSVR